MTGVRVDESVGIGAAARSLGTTERTLRYYEQRGLLPVAVAAGGRRRYDAAALAGARRVLALRGLGLPLDTVRALLAGDGPGTAAVLREQSQRLAAEARELSALGERVDRLVAALAAAPDTEDALDLLEEIAMRIVLTRIHTGTGDDGTTALAGGRRVDKTDPRLTVMGDVDELVSALGVAVAALADDPLRELLRGVQNDLFDLGADLAAHGSAAEPLVDDTYVERVERACDDVNADLEPPASFVLPGSDPASAAVHHARAICRRAERHAWALPEPAGTGARYLNRLADLLFVVARAAEPGPEPTWSARAHRPALR